MSLMDNTTMKASLSWQYSTLTDQMLLILALPQVFTAIIDIKTDIVLIKW